MTLRYAVMLHASEEIPTGLSHSPGAGRRNGTAMIAPEKKMKMQNFLPMRKQKVNMHEGID